MNEKFSGKVWVLGDDIDTDIIIPTEYHLYADYLITKGKVGLEFTSKVGDVKTEISRIK